MLVFASLFLLSMCKIVEITNESDIFSEQIINSVNTKFGVKLEREVNILWQSYF